MKEPEMDAELVEDLIQEALDAVSDDDVGLSRVTTFEDDGMLTRDRGLVLRFADGSEFQVTIVQSRRGTE